MNSLQKSTPTRSIVSQTAQNTTLWVGHLQSCPTDHYAGQVFECPAEGLVNNIQLYASEVQVPGAITLTLHAFDRDTKTWGPVIAESTLDVQAADDANWIRFELDPVKLENHNMYGFRLKSDTACIWLGESASASNWPANNGLEWNADSENQEGNFYSYFSLAYKVELCA